MMSILVVLVVLALAMWALSVPFPPNSGPLRNIIGVILIALVILWLLGGAGLVGGPSLRWR